MFKEIKFLSFEKDNKSMFNAQCTPQVLFVR